MKRTTVRNAGLVLPLLAVALAAPAEEIRLATGEKIIAEVVERNGETIVVEHAMFGRLEIPTTSVVTDAPAPAALQEDEAAAAAAAAADDRKWKTSIVVAAGGSFGNTDTQHFAPSIKFERENEASKTKIEAIYYVSWSDGDRDENRVSAGVIHDWYDWLPDPWLMFATARADYDEFNSWEYRATGHVGVGYKLIEEEHFTLTPRVGLGAIREWHSPNDNLALEGLLGADITWQISEKQRIEAGSFWYPNSNGAWRTASYANWKADLDDETNMALYAGLEHDYQSDIERDRDHNDWRFRLGLQMDF